MTTSNANEANTEALLSKIVTLLAATLVKDETTIAKKVALLAELGLNNEEIAAACRTQPNVVRARLTEARKPGTRAKRRT